MCEVDLFSVKKLMQIEARNRLRHDQGKGFLLARHRAAIGQLHTRCASDSFGRGGGNRRRIVQFRLRKHVHFSCLGLRRALDLIRFARVRCTMHACDGATCTKPNAEVRHTLGWKRGRAKRSTRRIGSVLERRIPQNGSRSGTCDRRAAGHAGLCRRLRVMRLKDGAIQIRLFGQWLQNITVVSVDEQRVDRKLWEREHIRCSQGIGRQRLSSLHRTPSSQPLL